MKRGDIKRFREFLNATCAGRPHKNGRFRQVARPYGDYLYTQDRDRFMVELTEWVKTKQAEVKRFE